ncbi:MAG: acyltransferase [Pirellulaceae bacterium]
MELLQPKPTKRIVELDALRALAAINLMLFHFTHVYSVKYGYTSDLGFEFPFGKYGVQLFFMLSGFVNAMTLLKKRDTKGFLANRAVRILPIYFVVVGINLVLLWVAPINQHTSADTATILANLTLVPNLLGYPCLEPATWTLQVEVLFYAILATVFLSGGPKHNRRVWLCYLLLCLVGCRLIPAGEVGTPFTFAQTVRELLLLEYMPLFIIGMFLEHLRFQNGKLLPTLIGIVLAATVFHLTDIHGHNPAATVLLTGILAMAAYGRLPILRIRPLVFISTISYSLYLLHDNLGSVIIYHLNQNGVPPIVCFIVIIPLVVLLSWLSTRLLERPLSQIVRRILRLPTSAKPAFVSTSTAPEALR